MKIFLFWLLNAVSALVISGLIIDYLEMYHPLIATEETYITLVVITSVITALILNTQRFKYPLKTVFYSATASVGTIVAIYKLVFLYFDSLF